MKHIHILILVIACMISCQQPSTMAIKHKEVEQSTAPEEVLSKIISENRQLKNWHGIKSICSEYLVTNPKSVYTLTTLGEAEDHLGNTGAALISLKDAVEIDPSYINAWFMLGIVYDHNDQPDKVIECYQKLLKLNVTIASNFYDRYGRTAENFLTKLKFGGYILKVKYRPPTLLYPPVAKMAGIQGLVLVVLMVGVDGKVTDTNVIEGPDELRQAAVDYGRNWLFEPLVLNGKAAPSKFLLRIPFKLQ